MLEDAGHLAVVWTAATCPSSAHAIGSAISQLVDSASAMDAQDTVADRNGEENGYRRQYGTASKRRRQAVAWFVCHDLFPDALPFGAP